MDTDSERVLFGYDGNQPVFIPQETADLMAKNAAEKRLRDRAHEISKRIAWRFERVFFWGLFYPVIWSVLRLGSWVASWFRFATRAKRQMFFIAVGGYGHPTGGDWEIYIASDFDQKEVLDREWGHDGNSPPTLLICVSPDTEGWLVSQCLRELVDHLEQSGNDRLRPIDRLLQRRLKDAVHQYGQRQSD